MPSVAEMSSYEHQNLFYKREGGIYQAFQQTEKKNWTNL